MTTEFVTGKVRFNYPEFFVPKAPDDKPTQLKYSVSILIPKSDTKTLAAIKAAQEEAIAETWGAKRPAKVETTLHDGDGVRVKSGEPYNADHHGHFVMTVSTKFAPEVYSADMKLLDPLTGKGMFKSGDYGRVVIRPYTYDVSGNRGVSFGFSKVQKIADGAPIISAKSRSADDFFTAVEEDFLA